MNSDHARTTTERWIHEQCLGNCPKRIICCLNLGFNGETLWEGHWELRLPWESILVGNQRDSFQRTVHSTTVQLVFFGYLFPAYTLTLWMYIYLNEDQLFVQKCGFGAPELVHCTCTAHVKCTQKFMYFFAKSGRMSWQPRGKTPLLFSSSWFVVFEMIEMFFRKLFGNYWILTDLPVTNLHLKSNKSKGIFRCVQSSQQDEDFHEFYSMMRPNRDKLGLNLGDELLWVDLWLDVVGMFWPKAFGSGNENHLVYTSEI